MIKKPINVFFIVEKVGPYHNSRFNQISQNKELQINVIETKPNSKKYLWDEEIKNNYQIYKIKNDANKNINYGSLTQQLNQYLFNKKPEIIFVTGWYEKSHHYIFFKSFFSKIPLILISDSRIKDHKRIFYKEFIKKLLLRGISASLVAGTESKEYLLRLNFQKENIFMPCDVVDNNFFLSSNYKNNIETKNYFLCIARFVKKKNHIKLLEGFVNYKKNKGKFDLVLIGDGPEKESILNFISTSNFSSSIYVKSWKQIYELPSYYKNSKALILASSSDQWGLVVNEALASGVPCIVSKNCGCYVDLIKNANTGWGFDSENKLELTYLLHKVESLSNEDLKKIKENIKLKISKYDLKTFSNAVENSIFRTLSKKKFSLISSLTSYLLYRFIF